MEELDKIESVLSHIQNVQRSCYKVGLKLIKRGDVMLGRNLMANGQIHDNSKFKGIEFEELFSGSPILMDVVKHHASTNPHHSEYWGDIHKMPDVYVAEMVCDWHARSSEFGSDLRGWIKESATVRYDFKMDDPVGKKIVEFLDLLLEKPFSNG